MVSTLVAPDRFEPGMYFLRHIPGWGGRAISAMQGFVRGGSFWTHAGLILDNGQFIQGQPGGAKLYPVADLCDGQPLLVSDALVQLVMVERTKLVLSQPGSAHDADGSCPVCAAQVDVLRAKLVKAGRALEGTKYSFLDYPALGLAEWARTHPDNALLKKVSTGLRSYINSGGHLICSALVDRAASNAGIHVYSDGRMPGDVTPEDLNVLAYDGRQPVIDTAEDRF